jgi:hypothetical protein
MNCKEKKMKINEDWLATIIAFVLMILAILNILPGGMLKF